MQTFMPSPSFHLSASYLDYRRLGKQRVEAWQILLTLTTGRKAWSNHPATLMWRGYEKILASYGIVMCMEWIRRGYKDTLKPRFEEYYSYDGRLEGPEWINDERVHLSHRSNLIRKFPEHYRPIFGNYIPDNIPYYWPVKKQG